MCQSLVSHLQWLAHWAWDPRPTENAVGEAGPVRGGAGKELSFLGERVDYSVSKYSLGPALCQSGASTEGAELNERAGKLPPVGATTHERRANIYHWVRWEKMIRMGKSNI